MTGWPVTIDDREYSPIPESWVEHGSDRSDHAGTRVYAVSAARSVRNLLSIRYATREGAAVRYVCECVETEAGDGVVPASLAKYHDWPRSKIPHPDVEAVGVLRGPEIEHLRELWADRVDGGVDVDERIVAQGGQA